MSNSLRAGSLRPGVCSVLVLDSGAGTAAAEQSLSRCGLAAERVQLVQVPATSGGDGSGGDDGAGWNAALERADGQFVVLLPGDQAVSHGLLALLVGVLDRRPPVAAVGPGDPAGSRNRLWLGRFPLVLRRSALRDVGGFGAGLSRPALLAELGWRLQLQGHLLEAVQAGRGTADPAPAPAAEPVPAAESLLLCRLLLDDESLPRLMPALRAGVAADALAAAQRRLEAARGGLDVVRNEVQGRRVVPDAVLLPRVLASPLTLPFDPQVLAASGGSDLVAGRRRILVVTGDTLGARMAGPAIRAWETAHALATEHDVVLAALGECAVTSPALTCRQVDEAGLRELERWCDVLVFQGFLLRDQPWLEQTQKVLVADVYDPLHLETLEQEKDRPASQRQASLLASVQTLNTQLRRADFFLCASDKQRDLWLGQLGGLGRINPLTYDQDENLDALIAVVPFGISAQPPQHRRQVIKGVVPGIGPDDKVILWGGGIYNWFDPLTLIRAVDRLRVAHPEVRLYFLGTAHPNPMVPAMRMASAARELAEVLGLLGSHVFFNSDWVPYEERQNYLLEADVGVSCHFQHAETAFSFRTRILDYLWAGLPIVSTRGDTFGDLVAARELGGAVPPEDVEALAEALARLLADEAYAAGCAGRVRATAQEYVWERALAPLLEFCRAPHRAPDRDGVQWPDPTEGLPQPARTLASEWALVRTYLRQGGVRELAVRAGGRLTRRAGQLARRR